MGIGTPQRGAEFAKHVGFDPGNLYTDPENALYAALGYKKDIGSLAFDAATPYSILDRIKENRYQDLATAIRDWIPWIPPKLEQGLQQGGVLVFKGEEVIYERPDPSTGAHAPLDAVLDAVIAA